MHLNDEVHRIIILSMIFVMFSLAILSIKEMVVQTVVLYRPKTVWVAERSPGE